MQSRHQHYTRQRTLSDPSLPVGSERYLLQEDSAPHDHDFLEFVLVTGGRAVHRHIYGEDPLRRDMVVLIRPGDWHQYLGCRDLALFNLYVGPELFDGELTWLREEPGFQFLFTDTWNRGSERYTRSIAVQSASAREALAALEHLAGGGVNRIAAIGHFLTFLGALRDDFRAAAGTATPGPMHPAVARGIHMMQAHLRDSWTLEILSGRLNGIHPSYLSRLFKQHTGQPPMAWLARARAERAATLLRRTRDDMATIGASVGWSDPNYFARRFRQIFGTSPSQYRADS